MRRRRFIHGIFGTTAAAPVTAALAGSEDPAWPSADIEPLEQVTRALLSMQRASWEQDVAAQAFLELGDDERVYLMAKEAAHRKVDEHGYVQGVCGAPFFDAPGRATEGQTFFLLMEAAHAKLG